VLIRKSLCGLSWEEGREAPWSLQAAVPRGFPARKKIVQFRRHECAPQETADRPCRPGTSSDVEDPPPHRQVSHTAIHTITEPSGRLVHVADGCIETNQEVVSDGSNAV